MKENVQSAVSQRLTQFLKFKKMNCSEFGRQLGVTPAYVKSIRKSIPADRLRSIATIFPDLNTDWLLFGDGEMLKKEETEAAQVSPVLLSGERRVYETIIAEKDRTIAELRAQLLEAMRLLDQAGIHVG